MSYDVNYNAGGGSGGPDNVIDTTTNNYELISGSRSKVGRSIISEYKEIDGIGFGNKAWAELRRANDTQVNRHLLEYYTEQSIKWLIDSVMIKDVIITTGEAAMLLGLGMLVEFTDVKTGDTSTLGFIAPWDR